MVSRITNGILLEHMQGMKNDLQQQIGDLKERIVRVDGRIDGLGGRMTRLEQAMQRGFEEARQHSEALQEDLEPTIRMVVKHEKKLARM